MSLESDPPDSARRIVSSFVGDRSDVSGDAPASQPEAPTPPRSRYVEGGELGRGGMGRVRAGYDAVLGRTLALKRAKDDSRDAEARLLAEARITASLDHPGIITVLDAGRGEDGGLYYVMRVVEGASFREAIGAMRPRSERVRLVLSVAQAMAYAHERGVVHRDLSPGNVRVGRHGEVVVMDWGLAATVEDAARGGVRCGTPGFTAPELREGRPAGPQADVFSLGVLLHLALTGELPSKPGLPAELDAIITKCLSAEPAQRYPTAQGLANDLRAWLDAERVLAHQERPWTGLVRLSRRHPVALAVGAIAALLLAMVTTTLGLGAVRARREAERATAALLQQRLERALLDDDVGAARASAEALAELDASSPVARGGRAAISPREAVHSEVLATDCDLLDRLAGHTLCRAEVQGAVEHARLLHSGARVVFDSHAVSLRSPTGALLATTPLEGGLQTVARSEDGAFVVATLVMTVVFVNDTGVKVVEVCPASTPGRFALPGPTAGHALVLCADTPWLVTPAGATRLSSNAPHGVLRGAALDDESFVVGTVQGELGVMSRVSGAVRRSARSVVGPVRDVVAVNERVVAVLGRDGLGFWRADLDEWLYVDSGKVLELRRLGDAVASRDASGWRTWSVDAPAWHRARFEAGLTSVAVSAGSRLVAVGGADSVVRVLQRSSGELREFSRPQQGVVSHVAFSPSGRRLAFGSAGPFGVDVIDLESGKTLEGAWRREALRARLVEFVDDDVLLTVDYGLTVRRFSIGTGAQVGVEQQLPSPHSLDLAFANGRLVVLLRDGGVVEVTSDAVTQLASAPAATAVAIDESGALVFALPTHLERRTSGGLIERRALPGTGVTSLAASKGRWAVTRSDGRVDVTSPKGLTHTVLAHQTRAAALTFEANALVTVGWDGVVRVLEIPSPVE